MENNGKKEVTIQVFKNRNNPSNNTDLEHIVAVKVTEGTTVIGEFVVPGGDFETAREIGQGFKNWFDMGGDIPQILPVRGSQSLKI